MPIIKIVLTALLFSCVACTHKPKSNSIENSHNEVEVLDNYKGKKQSSQTDNPLIEVDLSGGIETLCFTSFVERVENIPLTIPEEEMIGEIGQVCFADSFIYAVDKRMQTVLCFNRKGKWIYTLNKLGKGPEEYLNITKFGIHKETIYIYDSRSFKIKLYTRMGKFIKNISCGNYFTDVTMVADSTFLCFNPNDVVNNPYGIWLMNTNGHFESSLLAYEDKYPTFSTSWKYLYMSSQFGDCIYSQIDNTSYSYREGKLHTNWCLNIKQQNVSSYKGVSNSKDVKGECYVPVCMVNSDNWIFGIWGNRQSGEVKYMLYNLENANLVVSKNISVEKLGCTDLGNPVPSNFKEGIVTAFSGIDENRLQVYWFSK